MMQTLDEVELRKYSGVVSYHGSIEEESIAQLYEDILGRKARPEASNPSPNSRGPRVHDCR